MTKIAIIGAGSTVFVKKLLGDVFLSEIPGALDIRLMDIDQERLDTSNAMARTLARATGRNARILATTDRAAALDGADFVIVLIQVGGYHPATVIDFDLPQAMGLRQTIGDTLGAGGILRGFRTAPVLVEIGRDMMRLCPEALMLQYVNPMAINCWALQRMVPGLKVVGLCHSVRNTAEMLAEHLGEPVADLRYECAGINHMAFFTRFEKQTETGRVDLYPRLNQLTPPREERVRYDILKRFGYFVTESSEHFSEYVPWFIKGGREDLIDAYAIPLNEYPRRCEEQIARWDRMAGEIAAAQDFAVTRSDEYASEIIEAHVLDTPRVIHGNLPNYGLIPNLPEGCCVEVPCLVDANGVQPVRTGPLPAHLAALMLTNIAPQTCAVEAIVENDPQMLRRALALDPHTGAELSLDEIWRLADGLLGEHGKHSYAL